MLGGPGVEREREFVQNLSGSRNILSIDLLFYILVETPTFEGYQSTVSLVTMVESPKTVVHQVETTTKKLRAFFAQSPMPSVSTLQQNSLRERPAPKSAWISRTILPSPEDTVRTVLFETIQALSSDEWIAPELPSLLPIEAEWIGHRKAHTRTLQDSSSEKENYYNLVKEVPSNAILLYVHGGGF